MHMLARIEHHCGKHMLTQQGRGHSPCLGEVAAFNRYGPDKCIDLRLVHCRQDVFVRLVVIITSLTSYEWEAWVLLHCRMFAEPLTISVAYRKRLGFRV